MLELVVAIALVGVLSVALLNGITAIIRTAPRNAKIIAESQDQLQLVNYFAPDVRSTPPGAWVNSPTATGCTVSDPGVNVVQLTWANGATVYRASYRVITTDSKSRMDRYLCSGTSTSTLSAPRITNILDSIDPVPTNWAGGTAPAYVTSSGNVLTMIVTQSTTQRTLSVSSTLRSDVGTQSATATTAAATTTTVAATTTTVAATTTTVAATTTTVKAATTTTVATATTVAATTTTAAATTTTVAPTTTTVPTTTTTVAPVTGTPLNPTAAAQGFMLLTEGNALVQVSSLQGAVAVGGTLTFKNYETIAAGAASTFTAPKETAPAGLIVGGTIDWSSSSGSQLTVGNGFVHGADLNGGSVLTFKPNIHVAAPKITDSYTTPRIVVSADQTDQTTNAVVKTPTFPFASAFKTMRTTTAAIAALNPKACTSVAYPSLTTQYGNYTLTLVTGKVNVLNLTVNDLNTIQNMSSPANPDETTPLIINVTDYGDLILPTRYWGPTQNGRKSSILWNIPNATSVSFQGPVYGTMLAPNSNVLTSGLQLYGDIVAKTFTSNGGDSTLSHFDAVVPCIG